SAAPKCAGVKSTESAHRAPGARTSRRHPSELTTNRDAFRPEICAPPILTGAVNGLVSSRFKRCRRPAGVRVPNGLNRRTAKPPSARLETDGATANTGTLSIPSSDGTSSVSATAPPADGAKRSLTVHVSSGSRIVLAQLSLTIETGFGSTPATLTEPRFSGPGPGSESDSVAAEECPGRLGWMFSGLSSG